MRQVVVQGGDRSLVARGGAIEVHLQGSAIARFDPRNLDAVLLEGPVAMSADARRILLRAGVEVVFCDGRGRFIGRMSPAINRGATSRLAQARAAGNPQTRLQIARSIVVGKLQNQRVVVARLLRAAPGEGAGDALATLRAAARRAADAPDLDALRGIEGAAARTVFGVFGRGLRHPAFSFTRRTRRPPRDPVNAVLSYAYTLLTVRVDQAVMAAGLDPGIGFLHETGRGRPACALDLCEEWRPMVDAFVLALFNRRQLHPGDFQDPRATVQTIAAPPEPDEDEDEDGADDGVGDGVPGEGDATGPEDGEGDPDLPAVYLARFGRKVVLAAWRRRLDERLRDPTLDASFTVSDLIAMQARRLATGLRAETPTYTPFTWK